MDTLCVDFGLKKIEEKAYDVRVYLIHTLPQNKPLNFDEDLMPILSMIDEIIGFVEALDEQDLDLLAKYAVKELGDLCRKAQDMLKALPKDKALKFPPYMRPICDVIIEVEKLTEALTQHGKQLIKNEKQNH